VNNRSVLVRVQEHWKAKWDCAMKSATVTLCDAMLAHHRSKGFLTQDCYVFLLEKVGEHDPMGSPNERLDECERHWIQELNATDTANGGLNMIS
jgi:hypothetical protein